MNASPSGKRIISIDGGAGSGKTTSARRVAERLGFCYVDSGAVYRAVAFALREAGITEATDPRVNDAVVTLPLAIRPEPGQFHVFVGTRELVEELRAPEIGNLASKLAVVSSVRARVSELLREASTIGDLVVEGRDIGTVVFPDAVLKVFLTADLPVRAQRRRSDLHRQGIEMNSDQVEGDLAERDRRDSTRTDSPLRLPERAVIVDTSRCAIEDQVEAIVAAYERTRRSRATPPSPGTTT